MSETAAVVGVCPEIEFENQTYEVGEFDFKAEGLFARWMARSALEGILRQQEELPGAGAAIQLLLESHRQALAAHDYDWGGLTAHKAMASVAGRKEVAWLLMVRKNPAVDRNLVDRIWKDRAKRDELNKILDVQVYGPPDPTPAAPESAAAAGK